MHCFRDTESTYSVLQMLTLSRCEGNAGVVTSRGTLTFFLSLWTVGSYVSLFVTYVASDVAVVVVVTASVVRVVVLFTFVNVFGTVTRTTDFPRVIFGFAVMAVLGAFVFVIWPAGDLLLTVAALVGNFLFLA